MFTRWSCIIIALCIAIAIIKTLPPWKPPPTVEEIAARRGYGLERHYVTTSDGVLLEHHRIINKSNNPMPDKVAILNHGLLSSSTMWIMSTPGRSLGFYLTDRGYDVWLLNLRGHDVDRMEDMFSKDSSNFWNYTLHEIAVYDLPASIDYILHLTDVQKADFIGYSMGAATYFALTSELPQYTEKIHHVVGIAPAVFDTDILAMPPYTYHTASFLLTSYSYAYSAGLMDGIEIKVSHCRKDTVIDRIICAATKLLSSRLPDENINMEEYEEIIGRLFGSTSSLIFLHYRQLQISGRFAKFDYGTSINTKVYGQPIPPDYDLKKSTNPMAIFWSNDDLVSPAKGVERLISALPTVALKYKVSLKSFGHAAFAAARDAESIVNEKLHKFLISEVI